MPTYRTCRCYIVIYRSISAFLLEARRLFVEGLYQTTELQSVTNFRHIMYYYVWIVTDNNNQCMYSNVFILYIFFFFKIRVFDIQQILG